MIRISRDGPTVSFNGSPTVSPTTAASCAGEPLPCPSIAPDSMYFLPLSHAPPALPVIAGFLFGPYFVGGLLIGATLSAIMLAIFTGNAGGAWDNGKK